MASWQPADALPPPFVPARHPPPAAGAHLQPAQQFAQPLGPRLAQPPPPLQPHPAAGQYKPDICMTPAPDATMGYR